MVQKGYLVKVSSKLFGKKDGKDTFRMYYSLKKPDFSCGDFIEYQGQLYRITEIGKDVKMVGLPGGKHTSTTMHRLEGVKVLARSKDARAAIVTAVRPDGMQIMDSEDCSTHDLPPREGAKHGDEVEYVRLHSRIILL